MVELVIACCKGETGVDVMAVVDATVGVDAAVAFAVMKKSKDRAREREGCNGRLNSINSAHRSIP